MWLWGTFCFTYDFAFKIFKILAALYLFYIAFILLRTNLSLKEITITQKEKFTLISQGFFTAVSNPKAWIFMLSLLPPFLKSYSDLFLLTLIILMIEFIVLSLYAAGGSFLRKILNEHIKKLNKFSALCVAILGLSLLFEL
ncbi:LysE family transporter [Campylobacter sp. CCS1377]|uniref:LysE family transporter n=1 Tax=Campylobacter sp. CCS1377 TaxID=3158229 RepID=A0AAU7E6I7_9BACT